MLTGTGSEQEVHGKQTGRSECPRSPLPWHSFLVLLPPSPASAEQGISRNVVCGPSPSITEQSIDLRVGTRSSFPSPARSLQSSYCHFHFMLQEIVVRDITLSWSSARMLQNQDYNPLVFDSTKVSQGELPTHFTSYSKTIFNKYLSHFQMPSSIIWNGDTVVNKSSSFSSWHL